MRVTWDWATTSPLSLRMGVRPISTAASPLRNSLASDPGGLRRGVHAERDADDPSAERDGGVRPDGRVSECVHGVSFVPVALVEGGDHPQVEGGRDGFGHQLPALVHAHLLPVLELVTVVDQRVQRGGDVASHGVHLVQVEDAAALSSKLSDAREPDQASTAP